MKLLTLFSGGGIFDWVVGQRMQHYGIPVEHSFVESDPYAVSCLNQNFGNAIASDILTAELPEYSPHWLHASPPCIEVSMARHGTGIGETGLGKALASRVCNYISTLKPKFFSLENVVNYRQTVGYQNILITLGHCGYNTREEVIDAQHLGQPCARKRLILVAHPHPSPFGIFTRTDTRTACGQFFRGYAEGEVYCLSYGSKRILNFNEPHPTILSKAAPKYPMVSTCQPYLDMMHYNYPGYILPFASKEKQSKVIGNGVASLVTEQMVDYFLRNAM